ncbi:metastasis-associated in colon cancer protein 1-like [Acipenser oxyrinchus oxyrinchus]|uniref:Metastasis-associated in colon cancer protein 1 n=1 Tax=Acipenser oxyrinchus oxyrinchus TaxID=40147 RepID=A0AAD8GEQ5_ACIOX|nr:metastasis-associated in colon cancer protein 1-like [Acipenser oxyrinchus oxyrinchus]
MAAVRTHSFRTGGLARTISEGILIDLDDEGPFNNNILKGSNVDGSQAGNNLDWLILKADDKPATQSSNPFWNGLSGSNPFLDDIVHTSENEKANANVSILKEDPSAIFGDDKTESIGSSSDEMDVNYLLNFQTANSKSGRCKSTSDLLDIQNEKEPPKQSNVAASQFLTPDFEWLQNDKEAYKMAWLSHRQLTRSCLDLGVISQSPGWAQTQAAETHVVCKVDYNGGSVQLPDSDISAHIPQGHVAPGEIQELALKAVLDPPQGLNNDYSTTVSPLLEVRVSNLNTKESISLEMKIAAEIRNDPMSQVMTDIVCLCAQKKEGPYKKMQNCYIYKDTLQVKLETLSPCMYIIAAATATCLQPPASSVWDYIFKQITIGVYGPKHIHPSFTAVCAVFSHNQIPEQLAVSDMKKAHKNLPPVVLQLWGKNQFQLQKLQDLQIEAFPLDSKFEVKATEQIKQIKLVQLKMGRVLRPQFPLSMAGTGEHDSFNLAIQVKDLNHEVLAQFSVKTPGAPPKSADKYQQRRFQRRKEVGRSAPIPETTVLKCPKFQDRAVKISHYGAALKSVLRQPKIEYLLEYFKGDAIALLGLEKVKAIGVAKVKEWYIGFLRGKVGLVHCKNVRVISKDQVIDFTDVTLGTKVLLDQIVLPFKKLTYMYSAIQSLSTEQIPSWKAFAEALGYPCLSLEDISRTRAQSEADKVACVLEKLKEDCHSDKSNRKFQHELLTALLKIDCQGLVARLTQNTVILTTAVELGIRWRELAEKAARLTKAQIDGYEAPHKGKSGEVGTEAMWKPAYDFMYTWSAHYGDGYRDMLQDLHLALDKMKSPITRQWRQLTGALILVNCMDILTANAFPTTDEEQKHLQ